MLETTWFFIWGLLWAIYFILDGFDLGMGTLLPIIAKTDNEKRIVYNAAGPYWDGNEVWLITAGGVTFAAFPKAYAVLFSALYAPLLLILFALIFRAAAFEFRSKIQSQLWRNLCDFFMFIGNFLPALLFGVAFANLFMGIPIDGYGIYYGNIIKLLNPYGLVGGLLFVFMFAVHGAIWLALKSKDDLHRKAVVMAKGLWPFLVLLSVAFLIMTKYYTELYENYQSMQVLYIIPIVAVTALLFLRILLKKEQCLSAWITSAVFILSVTFFGITGMYPSLLISNIDSIYNVTIFNGASSPLTLKIMLGVSLSCVPVVIAYQAWVYYVFSYKVTPESIKKDEHSY